MQLQSPELLMNSVLLPSRLRLIEFSASHFTDLAKMNTDPEVMRYFPQNLNFEESAELLKRIMAHHQQNEYALFALHLTESDVFVGWCGLMVGFHLKHTSPQLLNCLAAQQSLPG